MGDAYHHAPQPVDGRDHRLFLSSFQDPLRSITEAHEMQLSTHLLATGKHLNLFFVTFCDGIIELGRKVRKVKQ